MTARHDASRDPLWLLGAVALAAVAIQIPIADRWFALLDEGYILEIADDVNRGRVLYRDVNVDAPFPGAFYLLAWWFRVAGSSILSSRVLAVAGFAVFATALYRIGRTLLPRTWALGFLALLFCYRIWAFPHWHIYSYSLVSATLLSVAVALLFVFLDSGRLALVLAAGLAAGAAIMSKQDYGVAVSGLATLVLLAIAYVRAEGPRPTLREALPAPATFVAGGALVVLPALGYFAWHGALDELVQQAFLVPLSGALQFSYTRLPDLTPFFAQDPELRAEIGNYFPSILATLWWNDIGTGPIYRTTAVWDVTLKLVYYAPLVVSLSALVWWTGGVVRRLRAGVAQAADQALRHARETDARRLLLLALACGFLLAFNRPRDWVHLMMVYPPSLLVGTVLAAGVARALPHPLRFAWAAVLVVPVAALCVVSALLARDLRRTVDWQLESARGGVRSDPRNGPIIDELLAYVEDNVPPGEPLPVYPVQPMLTFLAGREGVGGFHVIWPVQDPERDDKIVADLERRRPSTIVYSLSQYAHLGSFRKNAPRLFDYLVERYDVARVLSREPHGPLVTILRRQEEPDGPPTGTSLLDAPPVGGTPFEVARWPFARVLTHPVAPADVPAPSFLRVHVPEGGATFETAYGINPDRWLGLKSGPFRFAIVVLTPRAGNDRGGRILVLEETIDPARRVEDRRWFPVAVDLDRWAGSDVLIALSASTAQLADAPSDLAGWAEPRLVPRPPAGAVPPEAGAAADGP